MPFFTNIIIPHPDPHTFGFLQWDINVHPTFDWKGVSIVSRKGRRVAVNPSLF